MESQMIPHELFGSGDPLDLLIDPTDDQAGCAECGAPPDSYCTKGCPGQDTTTRAW